MTCKQAIFLCIILLKIWKIDSQLNVCNNSDGIRECCDNYRMINGKCEECIGSFGKNCTRNCFDGFYGFGCLKKCNCIENQKCDRREGCIDEAYKVQRVHDVQIAILAGSALVACSCGFLGLMLWRWKNNTTKLTTARALSGDEGNIERAEVTNDWKRPYKAECVYSEVRESRMVLDDQMNARDRSRSLHYPQSNKNERLSKQIRSQTLQHGQYGEMYANEYSQISFSRSELPKRKIRKRPKHEYSHVVARWKRPKKKSGEGKKVTAASYITVPPDVQETDGCKELPHNKEHNTGVQVFRPYSSVQCNVLSDPVTKEGSHDESSVLYGNCT